MMRRTYLVWASCLVFLLDGSATSRTGSQEQTTFNANAVASEPLVKRSIPLPDAVLQILQKDDTITACLKDNPIPAGGSLASWLIASEIHLNGTDEADLVVLPNAQGETYLCFHSAEGIGWFWVFRRAGGRYELVLKTAGLSLRVLDTQHHGYRDIRSGGQVGKFGTMVSFRFEGGRYREYQKKVTPKLTCPTCPSESGPRTYK